MKDGTLNHEIVEKRVTNSVISLSDQISLSIQLLEGIHFLHENKLIHRDIKPA